MSRISELLRFAAFEVVPSYQVSSHWGISATYLQGNALQSRGPQLTQVIFLNSNINNLVLTDALRLHVYPGVFFLFTDGYRGNYFTGTATVSHQHLPLTLSASINQTFKSNVPDNKNFIWNITLGYNFSASITRLKNAN